MQKGYTASSLKHV